MHGIGHPMHGMRDPMHGMGHPMHGMGQPMHEIEQPMHRMEHPHAVLLVMLPRRLRRRLGLLRGQFSDPDIPEAQHVAVVL